ncbi:hypothetical protein C8R47DRAFT_1330154 [Mycena vitilis]|nr:hypothetical protein C8R47DRAFT_1330154 [Mycena vitilis]
MAPGTRSRAAATSKNANNEVIAVDSTSHPAARAQSARRRRISPWTKTSSCWTRLRRRLRPSRRAVRSRTQVRTGDDEGMMDLVMVDRTKNDARVVGCNVTIADTSEYPKHHTIISYTDDADPTPHIPPRSPRSRAAAPRPSPRRSSGSSSRLVVLRKPPPRRPGRRTASRQSPPRPRASPSPRTTPRPTRTRTTGARTWGTTRIFPDDDDFGWGLGSGEEVAARVARG